VINLPAIRSTVPILLICDDPPDELNALREEVLRLKEIHSNLLHGFNKVEQKYRARFPEMVLAMNDDNTAAMDYKHKCNLLLEQMNETDDREDDEEKEPEVSPEKKKLLKTRKSRVKDVFRRVASITHSDNTRKFSQSIRDALVEIYIDAKEAYKILNLEYLIELRGLAVAIRSGEHPEEIINIREQLLDDLKAAVQGAIIDLQQAQQNILYPIYALDVEGQEDVATGMFHPIMVSNSFRYSKLHEDSKARYLKLLKRFEEYEQRKST
jgi:hypothetical protein